MRTSIGIAKVAAAGVLAGLAAGLVGCAPAAPPVPAPTGVTVTVMQDRLDIARNEASVRVTNGGADPIALTSLRYATPTLAGSIDWAGEQQIPAGSTRSITFTLPDTDCAGDAADAGTATLAFATPAGTATTDLAVTDPYGFLGTHAAVACFSRRLEAAASLTLESIATKTTADGLVAAMSVSVDVKDGQSVRIDSVKSTTLLQPAGGGWTWEPARTVDAGAPAIVELDAAPARCDLHAIAEDKVGTRFDTTVTILGDVPVTGTITLVASDAQRGALYDFVVAACGLPAS